MERCEECGFIYQLDEAEVAGPSIVEAADRLGVTLVGFLRGDGFNVYAHDERIDLRDLSGLG